MDDLDIWRSADILLKQYPGEAATIAAKRAGALRDLGDEDGAAAWVKIARAVEALSRTAPAAGNTVN